MRSTAVGQSRIALGVREQRSHTAFEHVGDDLPTVRAVDAGLGLGDAWDGVAHFVEHEDDAPIDIEDLEIQLCGREDLV